MRSFTRLSSRPYSSLIVSNDTLSDSAISMISSLCFNTRASITKHPPNVEEVNEEKEKRNCKQNTSEAKDQAVIP